MMMVLRVEDSFGEFGCGNVSACTPVGWPRKEQIKST